MAVVLAQDQLHIDAPGAAYPVGIGTNGHPFKDGIVAAGDQIALAFDLHTADPAGTDLVEAFQIAQVGNLHPGGFGGIQDGGAFRYLHRRAVDSYVYHWVVLPPLKMP